MRFEVRSAIAIGLLLPTLETARRGLGHWAIEFTTMFEDYLAGVLLLAAAPAAIRGRRYADESLVEVVEGVKGRIPTSSRRWRSVRARS